LPKSIAKVAGKMVVTFDHVGGGLAAKGEKLTGFAIAGADQKFVWADARIVGDTVEVSSPDVAEPAAVRYAWAPNPVAGLFNREGLPASPFRSDDWEQ
jgi:sialate O-acetylesterase